MEKQEMNDEKLDEISGGTILPYLVQPGDTLDAISAKYHVSMDLLMKWNNIADPNMLLVGQRLKIKF